MIERYPLPIADPSDAPDAADLRDEAIRACTCDPRWRLTMLTAINLGDEQDIDDVLADYQATLMHDDAA